ncbi:MAG: hypothetical protein M3O71_21130 [Bacteroidota bacterium]|nr:hypothetical protein [Bacteroidota bacterium]
MSSIAIVIIGTAGEPDPRRIAINSMLLKLAAPSRSSRSLGLSWSGRSFTFLISFSMV